MKRLSVALAMLLVAAVAFANVPTQISYQGQLTTNDGSPVNGNPIVTFSLYDLSTGGTQLWVDTDTLTVTNGLFDAFLGANTPLPSTIFTGAPLWLQIQVGDETLTPRQQLVSVPYSFHSTMADTALVALNGSGGESLWDTNGTDVYRLTGNVGIGAANPPYKLSIGNYNSDNDLIWMARPDGCVNLDVYSPYDGTGAAYVGYGVSPSLNKWGIWSTAKGWIMVADPVSGSIRALADLRAENSGNALVMAHDGSNGVLSTTVGSIWLNPNGPYLGIGGGKTLRIQDSSGSKSIRLVHDGTDGIIQTPSGSGDIVFESATGRVGIGTDAPLHELSVNGNIEFGDIFGNNPGGPMAIYPARVDGAAFRLYTKGAGDTNVLRMAISSGTNTEAVTFSNSTVTIDGDLCVTGDKNAIVPTSQGMTKVYCDESTSSWFIDRGESRLTDGRATVVLNPLFLETVTIDGQHPMQVDVTFYGQHGGYHIERTGSSFTIVEYSASQAQFSWKVEARRKGRENVYLEPVQSQTAR